jgi:hypothetical protein
MQDWPSGDPVAEYDGTAFIGPAGPVAEQNGRVARVSHTKCNGDRLIR